MKVSACMIVKNESRNIQRCINSYKEIVDEIIVVDTGSTDNTVEIAESLGAKVFFRAWDDDFSAAKNYALEHTTGNWVITLDADEYFEDGSASKLKEAILRINKNSDIDAIQCRLYNIETKYNRLIGSMPAIRVIRNKPDIRFVGKIHEAPKRSGEFLKNEYVKGVKIYHTGYSLEVVQSKRNRNLEMLKAEEKTGKADSFIYYYLTETCVHLKKYKEAIQYADTFISKSGFKTLVKTYPQAFRIYIYKSICMSSMKDLYTEDDIFQVVSEGKKQFSFHPELIKNEAEFLFKHAKYEEALNRYKEAVRLNKEYDYAYSNNFGSEEDKVLCAIGEIFLLQGDSEQAFEYFLKALKKNKYNTKAFNYFINIIKRNNQSEIIMHLDNLYNNNEFIDMEFLSIRLAKQKIAIPFLYYFIKNWKWEYNDYGNLVVMALLFKGDTKKALETAFSLLMKEKNNENEFYIAILLIYGNYVDWYRKNRQHLSNHYIKILDIFFNRVDSSDFIEEEIECYQKILKELFSFEDKQFFNKFVAETTDLGRMSLEIIGDILKDYQYYELAIDYYKKALSQNLSMDIKQRIHCKIGFCYYHLKLYRESTDEYEQALLIENENFEPIQYLHWIEESQPDIELKNRISYLLGKYSGSK